MASPMNSASTPCDNDGKRCRRWYREVCVGGGVGGGEGESEREKCVCTVTLDDEGGHFLEVGREEQEEALGVELLADVGEARDVAEENRHILLLHTLCGVVVS